MNARGTRKVSDLVARAESTPLPGAGTVSYARGMTFENLLVEDAGAVRVITVNRPAALNAINRATMLELGRAFAELREAPGIRAAIVTGNGEKSFVAGADITEFNSLSPDEARAYSRIGHTVFASVAELDIPVIAAVNGFALGGGLELALACDFIYAADTARLGLVEANLGLIPGFGGVARLARRVGTAMAAELIMSAAQVKADEALRIGLANKVVPLAELMTTAKKTADTMAAKGPLAIGAVKRLLREGENADLRVANSAEQTAFGLAFSTQDCRIGVDAFLAKSKDVPFVGR
jgi:enoyl-CoA hydratase